MNHSIGKGSAGLKLDREVAIKKITEMSKEQVSKVLIFMAGMEAEQIIGKEHETDKNDMALHRTDK